MPNDIHGLRDGDDVVAQLARKNGIKSNTVVESEDEGNSAEDADDDGRWSMVHGLLFSLIKVHTKNTVNKCGTTCSHAHTHTHGPQHPYPHP